MRLPLRIRLNSGNVGGGTFPRRSPPLDRSASKVGRRCWRLRNIPRPAAIRPPCHPAGLAWIHPGMSRGGEYRIRTGVHGFAIRCVTTPPTRQLPPPYPHWPHGANRPRGGGFRHRVSEGRHGGGMHEDIARRAWSLLPGRGGPNNDHCPWPVHTLPCQVKGGSNAGGEKRFVISPPR